MLDILLFIPQGKCYLWKPSLVGLHLISDALISIAYYSISFTLFYLVQKHKNVPFCPIFLLFAVFIVFCGITHLISIWTLWHPNYWLFGSIKALTAGISVYTAIQFIAIIPQTLDLLNPGKLETIDYQLQPEFTKHKQTEEHLRQLSARLNLAVESSAIGIWDWDITQDILIWDERMYELYGIKPEQFTSIYEAWASSLHPDDRVVAETSIQQALRGEKDYDVEFRVIHPDGTIRFIQANAIVQHNLQGKPQRMIGANYDITEYKQAEINLRESEQRYATLLAVVPVGIFRTDAVGNYNYVNDYYCQITGITPEAAMGEGWQKKLHPDDHDKVVAEWYKSVRENCHFRLQYRFQHPDGTVIWVYGQFVAEWDTDGQMIGYVGTITDISAQKQAEAERRQAEKLRLELKLLEELFDTALAGYWDWDLPNYQEYLSPGFKRMFGYKDDELPNSPDSWQKLIFPEDLPQVLDCFDGHIQSRGEIPFYNEVRYRHKNGSTVWVLCSGQVIEWNTAGEPLRMIGFHIDISGRKRAEEKTQHYATQLEASNRELESFAYSVSHDLRAPLRAIDGFSKALLEDYGETFDEDAKDYFDRICKNVSHMGKLIDDLLSLSRVSRYEIRFTRVNLSTLAQELMEELQASKPERQVELTIAPEIIVSADATLMRIVLTNLLQNAWKFTSHHPKSCIEFGKLDQEKQPVYFVRDDGAGFDMAHSKMLFGVFQRLHNTNEFPGTGIGLATVQRAIHRLGGRVWAEATVEEGATFYFTVTGF